MQKNSTFIVFTGDGKGKTSAALGLLIRALGAEKKVAFVQFIKSWEVSEHKFFAQISPIFAQNFTFFKGGKGFFNAGKDSARDKKTGAKISDFAHEKAARETFDFAKNCAKSGEFDLVICDEINNAAHDGLLAEKDLRELILLAKKTETSLCFTGRNFPKNLAKFADILTEMKKTKHHYDDGFLAEKGIDF